MLGREGSGRRLPTGAVWVKDVLMPALVAGPGGGAVLDGVLERVTFANPETGYTIARIALERGGAELVTAVGRCWARRWASSCGCAAGGPVTRGTAGSSRCTPMPRCCPPR